MNLGASAQSLKTTRNKNFATPLYFDVFGNLPTPPPIELEWDLEGQKGQTLKMGPVTLDEKTLSFGLRRLSDLDSKYQGPDRDQIYFLVNWPEFLFPEARLEILSRDGKVVWSRALPKADLELWQRQIQSTVKANPMSPLRAVEWAIPAQNERLPFEGLADEFRFCLSHLGENTQDRLCSQRYLIRKVGRQLLLGRLRDLGKARILVNGEAATLKGAQAVSNEFPTRFFAELATGETYDFSARPSKVSWADLVRLAEPALGRATGFGTPPIGRYQVVQREKMPNWVETLGFESTIGDPRKFWSVWVKATEPWLYFPGAEGGLFRHHLPLDQAPEARLRVHLDRVTPKGTYRDGVALRGRKRPEAVVTSTEHEVLPLEEAEFFRWRFQALQPAQMNRSHLLIQDGDKVYKAYYEMYKGYANELSARSSMVISTQGLILMGEAAYNRWFEDLLGWDSYHLTKQRWGLSGRYFQNFTQFKTGDFETRSLQVLNFDLKYRFTPGLWTRDESHGVIVSYQSLDVDVEVTDFRAPMAGFGWFWARSMPRVFDEIFNQLPFLNYPKWVDMEFIWYGGNMDSANKLGFNFALNFHGQVLWKDNFFGEAGFGIKRYDFIDKNNPYQANLGYSLNTLYGTVGLGLKF